MTTTPSTRGQLDSSTIWLSECTRQPWDERRDNADYFAMILSAYPKHAERALRVRNCARPLRLTWDGDRLVPHRTYFCRTRFCAICEWRRAMMWRARLNEAFPELLKRHPTGRFVFLTLTVRNVDVGELGATLSKMGKAWGRLTSRTAFKRAVLGWFRSTEITRGKDGSTHPHYHVVLFVKPSYFSYYYITQAKWAEMWQNALGIDYKPVVDVRSVKAGIVPEVAKYSIKPGSMIEEDDTRGRLDHDQWVIAAYEQAFGRRLIGSGGLMRDVLAELEARYRERRRERREAGGAQELGQEDRVVLVFDWDERRAQYKLRMDSPRSSSRSRGELRLVSPP